MLKVNPEHYMADPALDYIWFFTQVQIAFLYLSPLVLIIIHSRVFLVIFTIFVTYHYD